MLRYLFARKPCLEGVKLRWRNSDDMLGLRIAAGANFINKRAT